MCRKIYIPSLDEYFAKQNSKHQTSKEYQKVATKPAEEFDTLDKYLCKSGKYNLLTAEEERTLLAQALKEDTTALDKITIRFKTPI